MNKKDIKKLIKVISASNLSEFKMEDGEFKLTIRTNEYHKVINTPVQASAPIVMSSQSPTVSEPVQQVVQVSATQESKTEISEDGAETKSELLEIKSPIVGTFYRASSPDQDVFVKVGDVVGVETVVCIVEAMKLFNEIEAEVSGKIVNVMVEDGSPIEYDQVLFLVDPKG